LREKLSSIDSALAALHHPDGGIALLNDSALNLYTDPAELRQYIGRAIGEATNTKSQPANNQPFALNESGYFGARNASESYVICDAGPIGPDYLPGHAHGDIFSFELSLRGYRVIVDSGTHDYEVGEMRNYCRSTRAHNTIEIDNQDQCEFWGAFRVGRRGRPHDVRWEPLDGGGFRLSGWHDGYQHLPGAPTHRRTFVWHPQEVLMIKDEVT